MGEIGHLADALSYSFWIFLEEDTAVELVGGLMIMIFLELDFMDVYEGLVL